MALSADKRRVYQGEGHTFEIPAAASSEFFAGAIVCYNAAGNAAVGADTANFKIAGICTKYVDNSTGSAGDKFVVVHRGQLEKIATSVLVLADSGLDAVIVDDETVTDAAAGTNDIRVGKIEKFETGFAWVRVGVLSTGAA